MTEKNADVEWLRREVADCEANGFMAEDDFVIRFSNVRRLLAHIDQLEAERNHRQIETHEIAHTVMQQGAELAVGRPTVHEIAVQMMAAMIGRESERDAKLAEWAYGAAEALEAEGRRRDEARTCGMG